MIFANWDKCFSLFYVIFGLTTEVGSVINQHKILYNRLSIQALKRDAPRPEGCVDMCNGRVIPRRPSRRRHEIHQRSKH